MATPFQIADACRQVRSEKSACRNLVGQRRVVGDVAFFTVAGVLPIFRDVNDLRRNLDLLRDERRLCGSNESIVALRTDLDFRRQANEGLDLFRRKRLAKILFVTGMRPLLSFLFRFRFDRLDDVGGRRFVGCLRIFFECSDFLHRSFEQCFKLDNSCLKFGNDSVFRIHAES